MSKTPAAVSHFWQAEFPEAVEAAGGDTARSGAANVAANP